MSQLLGAPCKLVFFPCPDTSLPLRSPEVSNPHSVTFFPCPDRSLGLCGPQLVGAPCKAALFLTQQALARPLAAVLALCQALPCGGLSHLPSPAPPYALGPNASGAAAVALSAPPADPMPEVPSAMASAAPTTGSAPPHRCVSMPEGLTSAYTLTLSALHFALPLQCDLSCCHCRYRRHRHHCHRHCGHQHQGTTKRRTQPTTQCYDLPARMPVVSLLLKLRSLVIPTCRQYTPLTHSTDAMVEAYAQASELADARTAQPSHLDAQAVHHTCAQHQHHR